MRAQRVVAEVGNGLRRNLGLTVAVVITVFSAALLGGGALMVRDQISTMKDYWYDKVEVTVSLCGVGDTGVPCNGRAVTDDQRTSIEKDLTALPQVEKVYYESKEEAYQHFKEAFKDSPISQNTPADYLPESFRVKLKDPTQYAVVNAAFSGRPGVHDVQDQRKFYDTLFKGLNAFQVFGVFIALAMMISAVLLIANTIRVAAFTRRRETGIMRLVGASNLSIQLPFLLESAIASAAGALLACAGLALGKFYLIDKVLKPNFQISRYIGWDSVWSASVVVVVVSIGISSLASLIVLRRYLRV